MKLQHRCLSRCTSPHQLKHLLAGGGLHSSLQISRISWNKKINGLRLAWSPWKVDLLGIVEAVMQRYRLGTGGGRFQGFYAEGLCCAPKSPLHSVDRRTSQL